MNTTDDDLKEPVRCALYARSATSGMESSAQSQINICREAARKLDWIVSEEHVVADEASGIGSLTERPGISRILAGAAAVPLPFQRLVITDTFRLSRKLSDVLFMYSVLSANGVIIHVADQQKQLSIGRRPIDAESAADTNF